MDRLETWDTRWVENKAGWHLSDVNFALTNHGKVLLDAPQRRVLVPLCGKTVDLMWLYDGGHTVVGIEGIEMPAKEFFEESEVPFIVEEFPGGKLYKSEDQRLQIYVCDLFKLDFTMLGKFDAVWDRGSLVAIYEDDRNMYAESLKSVLAQDFKYLASLVQYEPNENFSGPPRNIPIELVEQLYGDLCDIKVLETVDRSDDEKVRKSWGLSKMEEVVILLTPKK